MENCTILGDDNKDFFAGVFENRPLKIMAVIFSVLGELVLLTLLYCIIWY
jgi:hypothetical protein